MMSSDSKDNTVANGCQHESVKNGAIGCKNVQCEHNFFYHRIFENGSHHGDHPTHLKPSPNDVSSEFYSCFLRLNRPLTIKEIASIYGISFQQVSRIVESLLSHLAKNNPELQDYAE